MWRSADEEARAIDPLSRTPRRSSQVLPPKGRMSFLAIRVATRVSLTFSSATLHMVWKGSRDDQHIYESRLENNQWTPQSLVFEGPVSAQSPSLASIAINDGTPSTGLIMAFKGSLADQGLYFSTNDGNRWTPPQSIQDVGSSHRPALANFGVPHMAWKGVDDDQGIYWSSLGASGWEPQQNVTDVGTSHAPALAVFQNRLYLFWRGIEGDDNVYYSWLDSGSSKWRPQQNVAYVDPQSGGAASIGCSHGPSATQHGTRLLLAWKGVEDDTSIYFSLFDGSEFTPQSTVSGVGTSQGPGLCGFGGITHMAWRGAEGDNGIYWSTMKFVQQP
jgi:hypothetical protein